MLQSFQTEEQEKLENEAIIVVKYPTIRQYRVLKQIINIKGNVKKGIKLI